MKIISKYYLFKNWLLLLWIVIPFKTFLLYWIRWFSGLFHLERKKTALKVILQALSSWKKNDSTKFFRLPCPQKKKTMIGKWKFNDKEYEMQFLSSTSVPIQVINRGFGKSPDE